MYNEDYLQDDDDYDWKEQKVRVNLDDFVLPPEANMDQYGMVLHILGPGGSIEEILFDIEDIYKYVRSAYKKCPKRT